MDGDKKGAYSEHAEDPKHTVNVNNFAQNVNAKIINPLSGYSKTALFEKVTSFCEAYDLVDKIPIFEKGALCAQDPNNFENIAELTEDDKYHLRREISHKFSLPKALYLTIAVCSLGSAVQGWDNTGANGANLSFPVEFGIAGNGWLVGFVNAAPTISGLMAAWFADPLNNWIGRRGVIFLTGLFCIFPVLGQAFTRTWWELLICRLIKGIGMGIKITTIPIMTSEIVPATIRGGLVMSFQLCVAFGILLGFSSNLVFMDIGPLAWRFQICASFVPAVPVVCLIWFCPESPRWLLKKYRIKQSYQSFCRVRNSEVQAARDLFYAYNQFIVEQEVFGGTTFFRRFKELFTIPRIRRATTSGAIVMMAQQFSGINIIAFYSSTIFEQGGFSPRQCLLASFGFGLINFIFAWPAIWTIDTFGRRFLLLFTFPNMAWCLIATGLMFLLPESSAARLPLIALFVYLFTIFYSPGIGPVPNVYAAECFPLSHREIGAASCIFVNNSLSSLLGLTFPSLLFNITPTGAFGFYAGLNMVAFVIIFFLLPETKQRTLEELDYIFGVPQSKHAAYYGKTWLPHKFKKHVLFQKNSTIPPLYQLEGSPEQVASMGH